MIGVGNKLDASGLRLALGEPDASQANAGPSDVDALAHCGPQLGDADSKEANAHWPEPTTHTTEVERPGRRELISAARAPDAPEPDDEEPSAVVHVPDLQTTQQVIHIFWLADWVIHMNT
jgi:hypothetical protein